MLGGGARIRYVFVVICMFFLLLKVSAEEQPTALFKEKGASITKSPETIMVKGFIITGQQAYTEEKLNSLLQDANGKEVSLRELQLLVDRITNFYHDNGYFLAKAYLPVQEASAGIIRVTVLEGVYGSILLQNQTWLSDSTIAAMLSNIKTGSAIYQPALERSILLLHDIPGINAEAVFRQGALVGTADLTVKISVDKKSTGNVTTDNYGYSFTGKNQVGVSNTLSHVLTERDMVSATMFTSGKLLTAYNYMYQTAVGTNGATLNFGYSSMNYKLGNEYEALHAYGKSAGGILSLQYPLLRTYKENVYGSVGYFHKKLDEELKTVFVKSNKVATGLQFGLYGNSKGKEKEGNYSVSGTVGHLTGVASNSLFSSGQYVKANISVAHKQALTENTYISLVATGQFANRNLDSSEKMLLGGPNGVRAYAQGEAAGDAGYLGTIELHRVFASQDNKRVWEGIGFWDYGNVRLNKTDTASESLSGAGVGISYAQEQDWYVRLYYAWKIRHGTEQTDTENGRLWLKTTAYF